MRTSTRLAGFAALLAVIFGLGWGLGAAVGPAPEPGPVPTRIADATTSTAPHHDGTPATGRTVPATPADSGGHEGHVVPPTTTAPQAVQP